MPITGGTRMLRARRKDCNVKPNRRLDRKSSRGMLYENEELRMRTITINAEVEQGQHALKKLRRENEQLRREMWSLRDEYDKMEKLLKKKEADDYSNQESSDSEDSQRDEEEDEEKVGYEEPHNEQEENLQLDDNKHLKAIDEVSNVRSFDGLSVIDEQTEETPTTESPLRCETSSRDNSEVNRTGDTSIQVYDEACGLPEYPEYSAPCSPPLKPLLKRKTSYENGHLPGNWPTTLCDTYNTRPPSPYPYNESLHFHDSYQKRFQVLENLSPMNPSAAPKPPDTGWILPDLSKSTELPGYEAYVEGTYIPNKSAELSSTLPQSKFPFEFVQDRRGPDVFVTDSYPQSEGTQIFQNNSNLIMNNLETKLDAFKIDGKNQEDPTVGGNEGAQITTLTKSLVSRGKSAKIPWESQEIPNLPKLTIDESHGENDNEFPSHVQPMLVSCQNPFDQDVRDKNDPFGWPIDSKAPLADEMPQTERQESKYQTKLTVTLKTPGLANSLSKKKAFDAHILPAPPPPPLKTFQKNQPFKCGMKPEYATVRFQTFPNTPSSGNQPSDGREYLVNHFAGVRQHANGFTGSLPRLPCLIPKVESGLNASHIPVNGSEKESDVLQNQKSLPPNTAAQLLVKPVKIPPAPPPRTTSCPKPIIPGSQKTEGHIIHQKFYMPQGKATGHLTESTDFMPMSPIAHNPLLLSQPIATSSPTISLRATKSGVNSSYENLCLSRLQKQNYNDESSNEDLASQKSKLKEEMRSAGLRKLNKSVSSPSFDTFRTVRRKPDEELVSSVENIFTQRIISDGMTLSDKSDKKPLSKGRGQNNVSVSSSSGLDSPVKNDRRKRRVSVQFKKKQLPQENNRREDEEKESTSSRRNSLVQGMSAMSRGGQVQAATDRRKLKGRMEETDATTSERERTNSMSSRTSSFATGSGSRRKFSTSSNRTYLNDEKIPWCGCWGNGCV